ncbi:MAG TPA: hypothetical protein VKY26_08325, partial [Actinomycetota bacterium]|nr:hypothetical protein [Actinomycetota bacterium]
MVALILPVSILAQPALAHGRDPTVAVTGGVASPSTYTLAELAAVTQTTVSVTETTRSGPVAVPYTGVLLETLVNLAKPAYPALLNTKNELLRVTVTVRGRDGEQVTMALGELDP